MTDASDPLLNVVCRDDSHAAVAPFQHPLTSTHSNALMAQLARHRAGKASMHHQVPMAETIKGSTTGITYNVNGGGAVGPLKVGGGSAGGGCCS